MPAYVESLQKSVATRLEGFDIFGDASIVCEGSDPYGLEKFSDREISVTVKIPMPIGASKYSAEPLFSRLALQVVIEADESVRRESMSVVALAEETAWLLHNWLAPVANGYSKITLSDSAPWERPQCGGTRVSVAVNFNASSVLEPS